MRVSIITFQTIAIHTSFDKIARIQPHRNLLGHSLTEAKTYINEILDNKSIGKKNTCTRCIASSLSLRSRYSGMYLMDGIKQSHQSIIDDKETINHV